MSAKFLGHRSFSLGISGTFRTTFNTEACPDASFQLIRFSGTQDANYRIWSTNFEPGDFVGITHLGGDGGNQMTGSAYMPYWTLEATGSAFTGSATDATTPFTMHFTDIGTRRVMVEVSGNLGGPFILNCHGKTTG